MTSKNARSDVTLYAFVTLCMLGGIGLTVTGLLVPNWVQTEWHQGIIVVNARLGLWAEELCDYKGCEKHWTTEDGYDSHHEASFENREVVRGLESAGVILAVMALLSLVPLWTWRHGPQRGRTATQVFFFFLSLTAAFLCVTGVLIMAATVDNEDDIDWAPILSGIGSALIFIATVLTCVYCRYDSTQEANDNTVSRNYMVSMDKMAAHPPQPQQQKSQPEQLQYRL